MSSDYLSTTVISSRIRLARNINGYPFPARIKTDRQAKEIIRAVMSAIDSLDNFKHKYMEQISQDEATNLVENRLISKGLLKKPSRSAVVINDCRDISIMINEEDHLREQCIRNGMSIRDAYKDMSAMDTLIARQLPFAYDERLGYLTACPTNLGTGLRASVMLFLPALTIARLMPMILQTAKKAGLTVRGAYGEGSKAQGFVYQVSNERTLGITEEAVLSLVEKFVDKVAEFEATERIRLAKNQNSILLRDKCLRAYGILSNCSLLSHDEFDRLCTDLKLGACLGFIKVSDISAIDELTLKMKPSNLNVIAGKNLSSRERDEYRATYVSARISSLCEKIAKR